MYTELVYTCLAHLCVYRVPETLCVRTICVYVVGDTLIAGYDTVISMCVLPEISVSPNSINISREDRALCPTYIVPPTLGSRERFWVQDACVVGHICVLESSRIVSG